jgi:hypothetical protein
VRLITPERVALFESDRIVQRKHDSQNRKHRKDSDKLGQGELDAECQRKAKSRQLAIENLNIKNIKNRKL